MPEEKTLATIVKVKDELFLKIPDQKDLVSIENLGSSELLQKSVGETVEIFYTAPQQHIAGIRSVKGQKKTGDWTLLCYAPAMLKNIVVTVEKTETQRILNDMVRQKYITKSVAKEIGKGPGVTGVNTFK